MATSAQKFTSKHAPNLWSGKHNWQDGEIKSATVETGIPEGGTVEDSSQFQLKKTEVSTASTVFTKQKSPLFFWVNVWLLPKNTWNVVCFPCFCQYISFWIGWILGALLFGKKTQHTRLFPLWKSFHPSAFARFYGLLPQICWIIFGTPRWDEWMK